MPSQLYFGNGDVHSFTPLTALTEPQQLLCTHLDHVRPTCSQLPQLGTGRLKWPNLLERKLFQEKCFNKKKKKYSTSDRFLRESFKKGYLTGQFCPFQTSGRDQKTFSKKLSFSEELQNFSVTLNILDSLS